MHDLVIYQGDFFIGGIVHVPASRVQMLFEHDKEKMERGIDSGS